MRVHGLGTVEILFAEPQVLERAPIAVASFQVALPDRVVAMLFDQPEKALGKFEALRFAGGAIILGHGVNGKGLGVDLLAERYGIPLMIEPPIHAAVLRVPELIDDIVVSPVGGGAVLNIY